MGWSALTPQQIQFLKQYLHVEGEASTPATSPATTGRRSRLSDILALEARVDGLLAQVNAA